MFIRSECSKQGRKSHLEYLMKAEQEKAKAELELAKVNYENAIFKNNQSQDLNFFKYSKLYKSPNTPEVRMSFGELVERFGWEQALDYVVNETKKELKENSITYKRRLRRNYFGIGLAKF